MMADRDDGTSAAMRRRQRRLRSWWRHERMSVAAALAEAHHHSAPKVGAAPYNAPRSQKTARASGKHPGVLQEPEVQGGAVTVGYVAAPAPFLSSPMLADAAAEAVDARTVKYLLKAALRRREEEEERKEWEMELARRDELQRGVTEALEKARVALEPRSWQQEEEEEEAEASPSSFLHSWWWTPTSSTTAVACFWFSW